MSGPHSAALACALAALFALGADGASAAPGEIDGRADFKAAENREVSGVDAFLGAWRSTRIARVVPDHARACLPSTGGPPATGAQQSIAAVVNVVADSPLGAWLIDEAAARLVLICQDPTTDLAAYYRSQMRLIGLYERLADPAKVMFLAHELAHVPQHPRFSNDLRFGARAMLVVHRMREATAEAVATRVLWQLRARNHGEPWLHKLQSAYGDIAHAFARAMDGQGERAELRATRAAFDQWFARPGRVHSYDARLLGHIVRVAEGRSSPLWRSRRLTNDFLRGIGWYGGGTFLPPGEGPSLADPFYAGNLSPSNAAKLDALLKRFM